MKKSSDCQMNKQNNPYQDLIDGNWE